QPLLEYVSGTLTPSVYCGETPSRKAPAGAGQGGPRPPQARPAAPGPAISSCGAAPPLVNLVPHEHPVLLLAVLSPSGNGGGRTGCALKAATTKNPENRQELAVFFWLEGDDRDRQY